MANIVITGAARGIGYALVKQYSAEGDRVFAMCRDRPNANALDDLAAASGGRISVHAMDVADDISVRNAMAELGDTPIDVLLNVAGLVGSVEPELSVGSSDWRLWHYVFDVMTLGPLRVLQCALPAMHAGARVINITSQVGASTFPYGGIYSYGAAKAALNYASG